MNEISPYLVSDVNSRQVSHSWFNCKVVESLVGTVETVLHQIIQSLYTYIYQLSKVSICTHIHKYVKRRRLPFFPLKFIKTLY